MLVWIVNPYGTIPGEPWREYRHALAARALASAGHSVVWWVANFEHRKKEFRSDGWKDVEVTPNFTTRVVPATAYPSNVSFARIRFERNFARAVRDRAQTLSSPDVIVLGEPALFTAGPILEIVARTKAKLVLDIIDLWPELFHTLLPARLSGLGRLIFAPLYRRRNALFKRADAFVAGSDDYLALAQAVAHKANAGVVYLGADIAAIQANMRRSGPLPDSVPNRKQCADETWVVYAGNLGENYDIPTVLGAAELLERRDLPVRFLIVADGALGPLVESTIRTQGLWRVHYLPGVPSEMLTRMYPLCDIGLASYAPNSTVAMPTKVFDYLAAGLPIVSSLGRDVGELLERENVGLRYVAGKPESLADAIARLAANPELRHAMRQKLLRLAPTFDVSAQYPKFVAIVERAVKS